MTRSCQGDAETEGRHRRGEGSESETERDKTYRQAGGGGWRADRYRQSDRRKGSLLSALPWPTRKEGTDTFTQD